MPSLQVREWLDTFQEMPGNDHPMDATAVHDKEDDGNASGSSRELGWGSLVANEAENNLLSGVLTCAHPLVCFLDCFQVLHTSGMVTRASLDGVVIS